MAANNLKFIEGQYIFILNDLINVRNKTDDIAIYLYMVPDTAQTKTNYCSLLKKTIKKWKIK